MHLCRLVVHKTSQSSTCSKCCMLHDDTSVAGVACVACVAGVACVVCCKWCKYILLQVFHACMHACCKCCRCCKCFMCVYKCCNTCNTRSTCNTQSHLQTRACPNYMPLIDTCMQGLWYYASCSAHIHVIPYYDYSPRISTYRVYLNTYCSGCGC